MYAVLVYFFLQNKKECSMKKLFPFQAKGPSEAFAAGLTHRLSPEGDDTMKITHTHPHFPDKAARTESLADLHRSCLARIRGGREAGSAKRGRTA